MLIEAARRAEAAAKEMLACINAGSAPCTEVREALEVSKAFIAVTSAFQVGAAQVIATAERHGDGGTQVLADTAGMSRREAHSQVKTARVIEAAPAVRDAVETGSVSQANARRLAEVKTSAADVESDGDLLAKAHRPTPGGNRCVPSSSRRRPAAGPRTASTTAERLTTGGCGPAAMCASGTATTAARLAQNALGPHQPSLHPAGRQAHRTSRSSNSNRARRRDTMLTARAHTSCPPPAATTCTPARSICGSQSQSSRTRAVGAAPRSVLVPAPAFHSQPRR